MPIRKDLKPLYPDNWAEIRTKILARAENRCERCGIKNGSFGIRDLDGHFQHLWEFDSMPFDDEGFSDDAKFFKIVLTIAHLDHDPTHNDGMEDGAQAVAADRANLLALCQQCHNRHDGPHRGGNRALTWDKKRGQGRFDFQ